jgi:hypothetical protein
VLEIYRNHIAIFQKDVNKIRLCYPSMAGFGTFHEGIYQSQATKEKSRYTECIYKSRSFVLNNFRTTISNKTVLDLF